MQILFDNKIYVLSNITLNSNQNDVAIKIITDNINNLEENLKKNTPALLPIFFKLKEKCVLINDNEYLRFLFFTEEEKELLKVILKNPNSFSFLFSLKYNAELMFGYSENENRELTNYRLNKTYSKEYDKYSRKHLKKNIESGKDPKEFEKPLTFQEFLKEKYDINITPNSYVIKINRIAGIDLLNKVIKYSNGNINEIFRLIYNDKYKLSIMKSKINPKNLNKRFFVKDLQLKDMVDEGNGKPFIKTIFSTYMNELVEDNPFIKDILKDYNDNPKRLYVPINFNLLEQAKNKKHLLDLKFKTSNLKKYLLLNRFNKISLNTAYSLIKVVPYVKENEFKKLDNFEFNNFFEKEKDRVTSFLKEYILYERKKKNIIHNNSSDDLYIDDYLRFLKIFKQKEKFNFNTVNKKTMKREHDRLAILYSKKEYKDMKLTIKDDNEFLKLKMPKDIKRLKTVSDFFAEGTVQSNCVFSYIPYVNKGKCMIYTMMKDDKKYTIEIVKNKKGYQLRQLSGFANSSAPTDVVEYVSNVIYENNKRLGYKGDNLTQYII